MLFLDEPSAGLDPQARLEIHELVQDLRREQRTILLTTHYIEEAEKLCDRVAIVDEGRIIAMGTPREIQERTLASSTIEIECAQPFAGRPAAVGRFRQRSRSTSAAPHLAVVSRKPARTMVDMVKWLEENGLELADIRIQRPIARRGIHRTDGKEPAGMRAYLALFRSNMRLTLRDRSVLFFNFLFPFIFFFAFAELFHAGTGQGIAYFVGTVLTMGILGNGLWGAGMRSVQEREADILRRFKVTPITPMPILTAAMVSGWLLYLPVVVMPGGAGAFSVRHAAAAELDFALRHGHAGGLLVARHRTDSGGGHQHHAGGHDRHSDPLHADAVPERRHHSGGDAAELGADGGGVHAGLLPGDRLPGNLLPQPEPLGQPCQPSPACC